MDTSKIRELLAQGQTGQALEALLALIRQDARYKNNLTRVLEVLKAGFERTRQQDLKGALSLQEAQREYSKTADTILSILDDVEAGRVPAAVRRQQLPMWIGAGLLVVAGLVAWLYFGRNKSVSEPECPVFSEQAPLHILIIPFDALDTAMKSPVETRVQKEISGLTKKAGIIADVKLIGKGAGDLSSLQVADTRGKSCKADLVVFGEYLAYEGDSVRVKLGYKFLKGAEQTTDFPFETFRDITNVSVTRDFQDALFSMCAVLAMREKNWEFARRWMDKIKNKTPEEELLAQQMAKEN